VERVSDDAVFESVRALAAAGEYLDLVPGVVAAVSPTRPGEYQRTAEGGYRRLYSCGTPEFLQARQAGLLGRLPDLVPAPAVVVEEAESVIGYRLPPLLRRLYLEVGNGGFGPGYGIFGLRDGHRDDDLDWTVLDWYHYAHDAPSSDWSFLPASVLPLCLWGCAIYSLIDCSDPEGRMWGWDQQPGAEGVEALFPERLTLAQWLRRWVSGNLHQPTLVRDPVAQEWRAATDDEYAQREAELADRVTRLRRTLTERSSRPQR
jgi:hypothetical protein